MDSPKAIVPFENLSNSKTPTGPFHKIVLLLLITRSNALMDFGPASIPSHPSGMLFISDTCVFASFENSSPQTTSIGKWIVTFFSLAFSKIERASSSLSSSHIEFPIFPPNAFTNVNAIPPPIISWSTFSIMLSIIVILEDTFAPPKIPKTGFSPLCKTLLIDSTSFSIRRPANLFSGKCFAIRHVEACALWAVPKASFI